jgi:hypothetical protein
MDAYAALGFRWARSGIARLKECGLLACAWKSEA